MSAFVYGVLNAQREAAPPEESKEKEPPGVGTYVDVVAGLVPAEVLAVNAFALEKMTESSSTAGGDPLTKVMNTGDLKLMFWLSIVMSVVLYLAGERTKAKREVKKTEERADVNGKLQFPWAKLNLLKALIPAVAYVLWAMLQHPSAFDGVSDLGESTRWIIALFGALGLIALTKVLGDAADKSESSLSE
jgi:Na+/H+ antiporter NhaC